MRHNLNVDSQDDVAKMITEFLPDIESDQSEFGGQSYQTKLTHISFFLPDNDTSLASMLVTKQIKRPDKNARKNPMGIAIMW